MYSFGPSRQSIRLQEYDYTSDGMYYITLCIQDRRQVLGEVKQGEMYQSVVGNIVQQAWLELPRYDPRISLDESIVMPNHLHGIVMFSPISGRAQGPAPTNLLIRNPTSLPDLVQRFKSWTTRQSWKTDCSLVGRLWQRGYYEHIIRNDKDLNRIREYIKANPANWDTDPENPKLLPIR